MITASIVLYKTSIKILKQSILSFSPCSNRILYLIDNSPTPLSESDISTYGNFVIYLHNQGENLGYGAAHNIAIRKAMKINSDYHIILNPDVSFDPKIINTLIFYADSNKGIVYILPKVLYPDGSLQYLCKLLPTPLDLIIRRFLPHNVFMQKLNDKYTLKKSGYNSIINPPCLSGCFMFLRISAIKKYNLFFDERFFMYCEDFDLIRRLHRIGKTIYYPKITIIHNHERSSYHNKTMLIQHIKSACKYFNKYGWFFDKERKQMNNKIIKEIEEARC
jgi:GT2 family glycosyltransferase